VSAAHRLKRVTFEVHRAAEYLSVKELQIQTGAAVGSFGDVATKELLDNAFDEAEGAGVVPQITVEVLCRADGGVRLRVRDNGRGLEPQVVARILNFDTRTSSKALYRSPTRGALGNALKALIGMPTALGCAEPVVITACGVRHRITVRTDPAGHVVVEHDADDVGAGAGITVELVLWLDRRPPPTRRLDTLKTWSAIHNWQARLTVWESELEHARRQEALRQAEAKAAENARVMQSVGAGALGVAALALNTYVDARTGELRQPIPLRDLPQLMCAGAELIQLAVGSPTSIVSTQDSTQLERCLREADEQIRAAVLNGLRAALAWHEQTKQGGA
jgi:hypothetical protein